MTDPNFILLYVADPTRSATFYADLLGKKPVEASPTFAMFALANGVMLGLWGRDGVMPPAGPSGGGELGFAVGGEDAVNKTHEAWKALGVTISQTPMKADYGFNFLGLDPDGHRLRVFAIPM